MGERTRYCPSAIYDPHDPAFLDEASTRRDLAATLGRCVGCERCVDYCAVFPGLFVLLERVADRDPERMTPAQQDDLVDECHQCRRCVEACIEGSDDDAASVDLPRMIVRSMAMRLEHGHVSVGYRRATRTLSRRHAVARLPAGAPGSWRRRWGQLATGISAHRRLPERVGSPVRGASAPSAARTGEAAGVVVLTCNEGQPIADAVIDLLTRAGVRCQDSGLECCGAATLYGGDVARFADVASNVVARLSAHVRDGCDVVVAESSCAAVLREYLVDHVDRHQRDDAELVASAVYDVLDYLDALDGSPTLFDSAIAPHHVIVQRAARAGADDATIRLLARAGATVHAVDQPVGAAGAWRLRATNDERVEGLDRALADEMALALTAHPDADLVAESSLAALAIEERLGRPAEHVLCWLARHARPPKL